METKEEILAKIIGVNVNFITEHLTGTVTVEEALAAMQLYGLKEKHDASTSNCYNATQYCECKEPKPPSMNRCICAMCGFVIPKHKQ